jgi:LysM repeat protein
VRLTQRGVVVLALAVAALGAGLVWLARASAPSAGPTLIAPHAVTVQSGDTLWSIATQVAPQRDPRAEIAGLQRRNHLTGVDLVPGQVLRVP